MKTAKTIEELAREIARQQEAKKDFLGNTQQMEMKPDLSLSLGNCKTYPITDHCHSQIGARLNIPKKYYDKMLVDSPELLTDNVNHWLKKTPENRMVRTLDDKARAFLSHKFRPLDNFDLLNTALPIISEKQCEIKSCEVTERRMYMKVLFPKMEAEIKKGDVVQAGLCLSNSEIGSGSLSAEVFLFRLVCLNGMIGANSMRKYHVGRSQTSDIQDVFTERTRNVTDAAFWMQVRDVIRSSFEEAHFQNEVAKLRESTEKKIESTDIPKVIEATKKQFSFNDGQGNDILKHLCAGGDFSQYGLVQAVTRTATDQEDYDTATMMERAGGQVLELSPKDWNAIAKAA